MILTEAEAKGKWCPYSRVIETDIDGSTRSRNRVVRCDDAGNVTAEITNSLAGTGCLASGCMAWRWEVVAETTQLDPATTYSEVTLRRTGRGYCGLAGQPMAEPAS